MNSEELERSLRAEFEEYLKDFFGEIKQEISDFQQQLDSEFKEHRARVDAALEEFIQKAATEPILKESFRESVTEHLRLAKDEGARITATAIAEAEELHGSVTSAEQIQEGFQDLRDAITDIASKDSQAEILKSLVHHASDHTPRGAFFIVKNEHLVGWRVFGRDGHDEPDVVRELFFPLSAKTALGEAVNSLGTVNGIGDGFEDEGTYLEELGFGISSRMVAIPLIARGRGVAVLYADSGQNGGHMNVEALESLVRVAGLTVELLASGAGPHVAEPHHAEHVAEPDHAEHVAEPDHAEHVAEPHHAEHVAEPDHADIEEADVHSEPSYRTSDFAAPGYATPVDEDSQGKEGSEEYSAPSWSSARDEESFGESESEDASSFSQLEAEESGTQQDAIYNDDSSLLYSDDAEEAPEAEPEETYEGQVESEPASFEEEAASLVESDDDDAYHTGFSFTHEKAAEEESEYTEDLGSDYAEPAETEYESESSADEFADTFEPVEEGAGVEQSFEAEAEELYDVSESVEVVEPEPVEAVAEDAFESAVEIEAEPDAAFEFVDTEPEMAPEYAGEEEESDSFGYSSLDEESARAEAEFEESEEDEDEAPAETPELAPAVAEPAAVADGGSAVRARLGDRNIDLPIEVSDEERQYHNAARRFARLLVSEIRLYNEQKVKEGCEANDLYDRLKEAIDRSREMYEKRVHGPVAERFDYFDYELVNNLAQGDESKLGSSYPGSTI